MLVIGITGFVLPLLHVGPSHAEFQAQSPAYRMGGRARELTLSAAFVVAGAGLYWHHGWACKLALGLLVISTYYGATAFAWGFSKGQPTRRVRLFSWIAVAGWNALWFFLIYRLVL